MAIDLQNLSNGIWPTISFSLTFGATAGPVVGQECKITLFATGGVAPFTFTVISGALPMD